MNKKYHILILIAGLLLTSYLIFPDYFPPSTPLKLARLVSDLKIPEDVKFDMLQDDWAPNGDGTTHIRAKLTEQQLNEFLKQATERKYQTLPVKENSHDLFIPTGIADGKNGYYRLEEDDDDPRARDYGLTIIDSDKKEMMVYIWYM